MTDTLDQAKTASLSHQTGHIDGTPKQQSNSKRFVFTAWGDTVERELCALASAPPPECTPVAGRIGVATARWITVDRQEGRELVCNRLHGGDCAWPWFVGDA
jgi:hypothetical protein